MTNRAENTRDARIKARVWMLNKNIRSVDIQRALEMKSHNLVSETMTGKRNNRRVLQYLVKRGCPVEYLDIPEKMRKEIML